MDIATLSMQWKFNDYVLKKNTAELTHEDSLLRPASRGNCLNWILGHILASRNAVLELLEQEVIWTAEEKERYKRGSPPITPEETSIPFERMLTDMEISGGRITASLQNLDPARLREPAPFKITNDAEETVGSLLAALCFHEAYHAGQTGLVRSMLGKEGTLT